jgi:hypothetical protein
MVAAEPAPTTLSCPGLSPTLKLVSVQETVSVPVPEVIDIPKSMLGPVSAGVVVPVKRAVTLPIVALIAMTPGVAAEIPGHVSEVAAVRLE